MDEWARLTLRLQAATGTGFSRLVVATVVAEVRRSMGADLAREPAPDEVEPVAAERLAQMAAERAQHRSPVGWRR